MTKLLSILRTHASLSLLVALAVIAPAPAPAFAVAHDAINPAELITIDRALDGSRVTIEGEAIGESLRAGEGHRWVNVLGGGTGVGAWLTDAQAETVGIYGDHANVGDTVRVVGTVNISCTQHGGEFDVHADSIEILEPGYPHPNQPKPWKLGVGLFGLAVGLVEYRLWLVLRDRRPD